jgi:diguanylate cyclase (GGDEF)-like protein/PAS domain S-box-containing protein
MRHRDDSTVNAGQAEKPNAEHLAKFVLSEGGDDRALLIMSVDGHIIEAHGASSAIFGGDASELRGSEFASLLATTTAASGQRPRLLEQVMQGRFVRRRSWCLRRDRSRFWAEVIASPVHASNGALIGAIAAVRDLTELKAAENAAKHRTRTAQIAEEEGAAAAMLDGITNAFFAIDEEWRFVYMNARCAQMLRKPREQLVGTSIWEELPVTEGSPFHRYLQQAAAERMPVQFEEYYPLLNSWFEVHAYPYGGGVVVYFWDISERKLEESRVRLQSLHDPLTGVPNTLLFQDRLATSIARATRAGSTLAVLLVDIDGLGQVNATYGHSVGDLLLQSIARRLSHVVRRSDTIARRGGDEFAILTNDHHEADGPALFAEKLLTHTAEVFDLSEASIEMTASIGIALYPGDGVDVETLIEAADAALARAKAAGGNTYRFFSPDLSQEVLRRRSVENELRTAITASEFELWYQPEHSVDGNRVTSMEALLRWTRPSGQSAPAGEFMPSLYATEVVRQLDEWALREACRDRARWLRSGISNMTVTVNLSPVTLLHADLVGLVKDALSDSGLDPALLELEFAQEALQRADGVAAARLNELRQLGVSLSLDGVGQNGFAAVATLERYPFNKVKFDQAALAAGSGVDYKTAIRAASSFAHALNRRVVAERIENNSQLEFVRACGCDGVQGDFVAEAVQPSRAFALVTS